MVDDSMSSSISLTAAISSANSSENCATTSARTVASAWIRSDFSCRLSASAIRSPAASWTRAATSGGGSVRLHSNFGAPTCLTTSPCIATRSAMPRCATPSASATSSSRISSALPSTMVMESWSPEITMSTSLLSSCWNVGFNSHSPSTRPTRTPATGPSHGTRDTESASDAAVSPKTSASFSWSAERTYTNT